jgi:hypothetical protein
MDKHEDQDELNRLLRKPGEAGYRPPSKSPGETKSVTGEAKQKNKRRK